MKKIDARSPEVTPAEEEAWRELDRRLNQPAASAAPPPVVQAEIYTPFRPDPHQRDVQIRRSYGRGLTK